MKLECQDCDETADNVKAAVAHVRATGHTLTGSFEDGSTVTASPANDDDDYDEDDDWNAPDQ